jgi:hypothetical protein
MLLSKKRKSVFTSSHVLGGYASLYNDEQDANELIQKMIALKILKEGSQHYIVAFTQCFNHNFTKVSRRLAADATIHSESSDTIEGLKAVLLNYLEPAVVL